ncbi:MAG: hypothetical protein RLZZ305_1234 [Actinomycetota bacterium]|jgi:hypothetical protein
MDPTSATPTVDPRAGALLDAVLRAYPGYLAGRMHELSAGHEGAQESTERAVSAACAWLRDALGRLLAADPDVQRASPLHVIRGAARFANTELAVLGVPEPQRDEFERSAMPDDTYALGPVAWIDLGQEVHDAGIEWGAWKAAVIISRRRQEQTGE